MDPPPRPIKQPSLEYHSPLTRLPGPAVWLGIPAVVFAGGSIVCLFFATHSEWLPDSVAQFMRRSIGWPSDVFSTAAIIAWFLGLLLGFAGMYLPKGNRLLPALALLLCVLGLATGGLIATWRL
jgi:hypothetical protein